MNIIVTSGKILENIDKVRSISNHSTGELGKLIATKLEQKKVTVYYVYSEHLPPNPSEYMKNVFVKTIEDLEKELTNLLITKKIDVVIHAMAVSDYRPVGIIKNGITVPIPCKISSNDEKLILVLSKNKKVISIIKNISPKTKLIGFKLLANVSEEELVSVAKDSMKKNKADIVVANDIKNITKNRHRAIIIEKNNQTIAKTKKDIANILIEKLMALLPTK